MTLIPELLFFKLDLDIRNVSIFNVIVVSFKQLFKTTDREKKQLPFDVNQS